MLTKIVVVVDNHKEVFEGENLRVNGGGTAPGQVALKVIDDDMVVATFDQWSYWRITK